MTPNVASLSNKYFQSEQSHLLCQIIIVGGSSELVLIGMVRAKRGWYGHGYLQPPGDAQYGYVNEDDEAERRTSNPATFLPIMARSAVDVAGNASGRE